MYWLDLDRDKRSVGLEPEIFRLAEGEQNANSEIDGSSADICRRFRLNENPWKPVSRNQVLHDGKQLDGSPWHYLCITVGAGTGKTMAAKQAEYLLAEADYQALNIFIEFSEIKHGANAIMGTSVTSAVSDQNTPLLIQKLQSVGTGNNRMSGRDAWELLQHKIRSGQLTLIVDAIDQFRGKIDLARDAASALKDFLVRYPSVRCIVTGRPYAIQRFSGELFDDQDWNIVQLGKFTEDQAKRRINNDTKWNWLSRQGNISMGVPRWIDVLVSVDEHQLGDDVQTLSDLYLLSLEKLMKGARKEQLEAIDEYSAWYLFAMLAFEMITDPDGPFRGQSAGISSDDIDSFKDRIWSERQVVTTDHGRPARLKAAFANYEAFDKKLGQLGALNEMLDDPVIAGNEDDPSELKQIFWRDQTLQDMFAALWMTRWATEDDCEKLRSKLFVRWRKETADYEDMWRLATEMPGTKRGRKDDVYIRTMSVLYEPSTPERPAVRSTEMIWRSWQVLENIPGKHAACARKVFDDFRTEYRDLLGGRSGDVIQKICQDFETWFVDIDPAAAGWSERDTDVYGAPLPVVSHEYQMAAYTVTNELYVLFDSSLHNRYEICWGPVRHPFEICGGPVEYSRKPVVFVDWCDCWCFSRWVGGGLPTSVEWEYACRAGSRQKFSVGNGELISKDDAWFGHNQEVRLLRVDAYTKSNSIGIFQMHGNVWEWCKERVPYEDFGIPGLGHLAESYTKAHIVKGGAYSSNQEECHSSYWKFYFPSHRTHRLGFRVARYE